jgi:trehalose 6-phosphate synthase/phosphatase
MHLVSYRGPGVAGGVSTGLQSLWQSQGQSGDCWWFLEDNAVKKISQGGRQSQAMAVLDDKIVAGHYRYCNEFLWPVMHDMSQYARYYPADRESYHRFNSIMAQAVANTSTAAGNFSFVQDYQLALLPLFLKLESGGRSVVFWHIPWPRKVSRQHVEPLMAIARALLSCDQVGFHTAEYAKNFFSFVRANLPAFEVNVECNYITARSRGPANVSAVEAQRSVERYASSYITRPLKQLNSQQSRCITSVRACPLTIDVQNWQTMAAANEAIPLAEELGVQTRFIISVDRADYTKGVRERFRAIDEFFTLHPGRRGEISFLQVCGRTRPGMRTFDEYWIECQSLAAEINQKWQVGNWKPIVWVDRKLSSSELAGLYRSADGMLITAVRDGLNLTAKEFVASQADDRPGVLLLSTGTGVWQEFQNAAVGIDTSLSFSVSEAISRALIMDHYERKLRISAMRSTLNMQSLSTWWHTLTTAPAARRISTDAAVPRRAVAG